MIRFLKKNEHKSPEPSRSWCADCDLNPVDSSMPESGMFFRVFGDAVESDAVRPKAFGYTCIEFALCSVCLKAVAEPE